MSKLKLGKFVEKRLQYFFVIPACLVVFILLGYPVVSSILYSFTDRNLLSKEYSVVGIENYVNILKNQEFWISFSNSITWTVASVTSQLLLGLLTAILLNRIKHFKGLFRTIFIIPWAFPNIVMAFTWKWLYNDMYGVINNTLINFNLIHEPILFLASPHYAMLSMVIINTWFGFPFMAISILAGLQAIPLDNYEAARIDGANGWQAFLYITIPHIKIVIGLIVILRTIWVFNNFDLIFLITGGGPGTSTETLPIFAYKTGWVMNNLGQASAISVILLVFLLIISSIYFRVLNKSERGEQNA